ncbi:polymorphic toxin-type HINT domain-containing protein [Streptomyces sp. NPDC000927]|uniref:polymorphic toxin-type HINT domain-containing protein n=1 Tax=Streptomyces sp. NPDC000927 TaxID=3154371 RepID=UPI003320E8DE
MTEPGPAEGQWRAAGQPPSGAPFVPPPPDHPPAPVRRSWRERFRALSGRRRVLLLAAVGALVLALVGGLLTWVDSSSSESAPAVARRDLRPFEEAVDDLGGADGLRYRDTAIAGITERDITVTASGNQFGSTSSGIKRHDRDVLRIGRKDFTRWKVDPVPDADSASGTKAPGKKAPGAWTVGFYGNSDILDEILDQRPSPSKLAAQLSHALQVLADAPRSDASTPRRTTTVNGTPALGIDTSAGRLLVTRNKPYRVLRLEPYDLSETIGKWRDGKRPTEVPRVTTGPLADGGSEGMDLTPIVGDAVKAMYDTLVAYADQLKDASDQGINFTLDGSGDLNCGSGGCTAHQKFTGKVTTGARSRVTDGKVTAVMSATFTIGGQSAGRCTSSRGTFPLSGNSVSGTLTCTNPGAGPVYTSVAAKYRADALAESRASGGRTVRYSIPLRASTLIDARALATVEVKQLVDRVRRERDGANCVKLHSFPPGTQVLLADGTTRSIEAVRVGDRVTATDPETGLTAARPVTDTITTEDDKDFTRLTVVTDRGRATLTATDNHPFWLTGARRWADAEDIRPGDELRSPTGASFRVAGVADEKGLRRTHDLTVGDLHTYYVLAGTTPVLVHNSGPGCGSNWMSPDKLPHHYMRTSDQGVRHAEDFGVKGPYNKANGEAFIRAIGQFVKNPGTRRIQGTYRGRDAVHYVDDTGLHASFAANGPNVGEYLGGWRSSGDQLTYLLRDGKL